MIDLTTGIFIFILIIILYYIFNSQNEKMTSQTNQNESNTQKTNKTLGVYYTEWCGYSRQFLQQLNDGLLKDIQNNNVTVKLVDCDKDKETCAALNISGFPTVILHTTSDNIAYNGDRSHDDLINFIKSH